MKQTLENEKAEAIKQIAEQTNIIDQAKNVIEYQKAKLKLINGRLAKLPEESPLIAGGTKPETENALSKQEIEKR